MCAAKPMEARCGRCSQFRTVFIYKTLHDCVADIGMVDLADAATHLAWFEENGDRWCQGRVNRLPHLVCVPCHDKETIEEQEFIDEWLAD